jgi:hypothetical protein
MLIAIDLLRKALAVLEHGEVVCAIGISFDLPANFKILISIMYEIFDLTIIHLT